MSRHITKKTSGKGACFTTGIKEKKKGFKIHYYKSEKQGFFGRKINKLNFFITSKLFHNDCVITGKTLLD